MAQKADCEAMNPVGIEEALRLMPHNNAIGQLVSFYKVLADDTRLRILLVLRSRELCAGDISVALDMTKSAISHQLAVMRDIHLIKGRRVGKNVYYSLDDDHVTDIINEALQHMAHSGTETDE